ncbi:GNAT family N-acetyltransferase [Cellulomonas sp. WB94]|uniref:GNAT family N-acetyltransferase n=1 Tax=Cellulomonas sp. WB94 TaxID=2173174 RepID=UPI000D57EFFB|nr:GNAT family N-acetyltransferase [Cellulomonas sp. WB94]PVU83119.1 GNAT family N-acetyltransferase [Cellulomonas sp. WB94]
MQLREATSEDLELLDDMLLEAFNWDGTARLTRDQVVADVHTARYLGGWRRPGDFGLVAVEGETPLGAIWARALPAAAPGYGYVADDIPEIGMGVSRGRRGQGVGSALLAGCIEQARTLGWRALSLSVEDGNDAARALYARHGFSAVGRNGGSDTLLREL